MPDTRGGHRSLTIEFEGRGVERLDAEIGGHRFQRIPTTERRGRVHSSTVTVAVLGGTEGGVASPWVLREREHYSISWFSGSGSGGQHRNRHMNSARVTHLPTGIVKTAQTRSRENSLQNAMEALNLDLDRKAAMASGTAENGLRRDQVGTGERSDKRRTYRGQDGLVHDHSTGRSAPIEKVMAGRLDLLWR